MHLKKIKKVENSLFYILRVENKNFTDKILAETYLNEVIKTLKEKRKHLKVTPLNTTIQKFKNYMREKY